MQQPGPPHASQVPQGAFETLAASLVRLRALAYSCCRVLQEVPSPLPLPRGMLDSGHIAAICGIAQLAHLELCVDGLSRSAQLALLSRVPRMLRLRELALLFGERDDVLDTKCAPRASPPLPLLSPRPYPNLLVPPPQSAFLSPYRGTDVAGLML